MIPPEAVPPKAASVAIAVLRGARTVREVQEACGIASTETVLRDLRIARLCGMVDWDDHHRGTLHSTIDLRPIERVT